MEIKNCLNNYIIELIDRNKTWEEKDHRLSKYTNTKTILIDNQEINFVLNIIKQPGSILKDFYFFTLHVIGNMNRKEEIIYFFQISFLRQSEAFTACNEEKYNEFLNLIKNKEGEYASNSNQDYLYEIEPVLCKYALLTKDKEA